MDDYILRITAGDGSALAFIATTKNTVQKAAEIHCLSPLVSAALGRLLTAAAIMGSQLKNEDDIITINIKGDGPIGGLVVTSDSMARVKGYAFKNDINLNLKSNGKLDVAAGIGKGSLNVIKDLGLKEPYVGTIPLVSGEIAEDLAYYFTVSEQTPSAVGLGVLVDRDYTIKQAGGFFIQMLPNAPAEIVTALESKISSMQSVTDLLDGERGPYNIADILFHDIGYKINEKIPVEYFCNCSRQRVEKALISLGKEEIMKIIKEDRGATLHCHFCNKDYKFSENELMNINIS